MIKWMFLLLVVWATTVIFPLIITRQAEDRLTSQIRLLVDRQAQEHVALEARIQRLHPALAALAPKVSDLCVDAPVFVPWDGFFAQIGQSVVCGSDAGILLSDTVWSPGVPYARELQSAYENRDYWWACAKASGPCDREKP